MLKIPMKPFAARAPHSVYSVSNVRLAVVYKDGFIYGDQSLPGIGTADMSNPAMATYFFMELKFRVNPKEIGPMPDSWQEYIITDLMGWHLCVHTGAPSQWGDQRSWIRIANSTEFAIAEVPDLSIFDAGRLRVAAQDYLNRQ